MKSVRYIQPILYKAIKTKWHRFQVTVCFILQYIPLYKHYNIQYSTVHYLHAQLTKQQLAYLAWGSRNSNYWQIFVLHFVYTVSSQNKVVPCLDNCTVSKKFDLFLDPVSIWADEIRWNCSPWQQWLTHTHIHTHTAFILEKL